MSSSNKCLVISSDTEFKQSIKSMLSEMNIDVTFIIKTNRLYSTLKKAFNVVLYDLDGEAKDHFESIENIKILSPALPIMVVSSSKKFETAQKVIRAGLLDYITKPVSKKTLTETIGNALRENFYRISKNKMMKYAQQRTYEIVLLKEIGEAMTQPTLNINYLLDKIIHLIADLLDVKIVSIMMVDAEAECLKMSAYKGPSRSKKVRDAKIKVGEGVAGHVAMTGEPLLINDIESAPKFSQSNWGEKVYSTKSLLTVPIKLKDKVIGIVNINNKTDGSEFNDNDKNILTTISNQVAVSIDNFKLYTEIAESAKDLKTTNQKLAEISSAKSELLCNLSHELKTPLTSVIGYLELLLNFSEGESEETKDEYLNIIHSEALKIAQLIERILNFFNLETNKIEWNMSEVNINSIIEEIIKQFQSRMAKQNIKFRYENKIKDVKIYADINMLQKAFEHLLDNAIKFNDDRRVINIKVENYLENHTSYVRVIMFNTGKKIKDEHIEKIFEDFYQPGNVLTDKPEGVGLGLATVQGIFKKHKGFVRLDTSNEDGNTFLCAMPIIDTI